MRRQSLTAAVAAAILTAVLLPANTARSQAIDVGAIAQDLLKQIAEGADESAVRSARNRLVNYYDDQDSQNRGFSFVREVAAKILAMDLLGKGLHGSGTELAMRQVNLGIAISQMPQSSALPLLEKMAVHESASLRLYGWVWAANAKVRVLAQGPEFATRFGQCLLAGAAAEKSPPVLVAMFRTLHAPADQPPGGVSADIWKQWQATELKALSANWSRWMQMLVSEGQEMAQGAVELVVAGEPSQSGPGCLANLASTIPATDKAGQKTVAQLTYELAWFASEAFRRAEAGSTLANTLNYVLLRCEDVLNGLTGARQTFIAKALNEAVYIIPYKKADGSLDYPSALRVAVLSGWFKTLKDLGVTQPAYKPPPEKPAAEPTKPAKEAAPAKGT